LFIIFEILDKINTNNIYKEEKKKKEIQIEEERKNRDNKKDKKVNIDESKNLTLEENKNNKNDENNDKFTLEEGVVNQSYILAQGKQLANPTPKYQAILPEINCSYLN
jgi:hypothetical protein